MGRVGSPPTFPMLRAWTSGDLMLHSWHGWPLLLLMLFVGLHLDIQGDLTRLVERQLAMCDLCNCPPTGSMNPGAAVTFTNADKLVFLRDLAELALKFYNDTISKSFKLVKVCKINCVNGAFYGLTFKAREDGSEECPVFRGVVNVVGGKRAFFCEIKDDDGIRLLPGDDDYVSSEPECEGESRRQPV